MLFLISAFSDFSEIRGSQNDNENLCGLKGKYRIPDSVRILFFECSFLRYYITVFLSAVSGCSLAGTAYLVQKWKIAVPKLN